MTAQTISNGTGPTASGPRLLRAQLEIIAQSLPMTVVINPTWALLVVLPLFLPGHPFGEVSLTRIGAAMGLHLLDSAVAWILYRKYQADSSNVQKWFNRLTLFQFAIAIVWGLMVWLIWENGNALNNVFVIMAMVGVLWCYALSRTMNMGVYLASVLPIVALASLRAISGQGPIAHALVWALPAVFAYTLLLAVTAMRRIVTMLFTSFANEDMTIDLRHAHDEALLKRFEAETANASKTTFLANMSHELRTPLNAILGFSDIIAHERLGEVGTTRYKEYAHDINASGTHLLNIINDILDIAKIESGKMEIFPQILDPHLAIDEALKVVSGRARERHQTLSVQMDDDVPMPYADDRALKQIVINLVGNAVKFTQEGGRIDIIGRRAAGGFELCISDNGPGIEAGLLERIFTPFNQIDNRYNRSSGGTGLGLSLVRGLAELHGGKAWIESGVGQGTHAHVYFPVANAPGIRARGLAQA